MSQPDRVFYDWLHTRLTGDSTLSARGVVVVRDDYPEAQIGTPPKIEYSPLRGEGVSPYVANFGLTIHVARDSAFGLGANPRVSGHLDAIDDAMLARILNVRPTLTGFSCSAIALGNRRRTTIERPETITLRREFTVVMIPGGSAVPMMGTEADLTSAGINGTCLLWQFGASTDLDRDHTEQQDEAFRYTGGDVEVHGSFDVLPHSAATAFPTPGSSFSATLTAAPGVSWTDTFMVASSRWAVDRNDGSPQVMRISVAVTNADSPMRGGGA